MDRRAVSIVGLTLAFAVVVATAPLVGQSAAANPQKGSGKAPTSFRTTWGDPDLQGTWSYASMTPLERPADVKGREFFTREEAAARERAAETDGPPVAGDTGNYNVAWFDRGKILGDLRTSLIVDPPDGLLPLTDAAKKMLAEKAAHLRAHPADSWLDLTPWVRCIAYHGVPPVSTGYNNTYQIFQTPGYVAILDESIHDVRIIPLDGRPKVSDRIGFWNGDSRGRWEGNTLVVETTNYSDKTEMRFPTTPKTRAVERFTRTKEDLIDYEFTVEDPTLYTRPWKAVRPMPLLKDYRIYEYACHEGNYALTGILAGARAQEKKSASPTAPAGQVR